MSGQPGLFFYFSLRCVGSFCSGDYCHLLISILCSHILSFLALPNVFLPLGGQVVSVPAGRRPGVYRPNPQISPFVLQLGGITVIRLMKGPNKDSMRALRGIRRV